MCCFRVNFLLRPRNFVSSERGRMASHIRRLSVFEFLLRVNIRMMHLVLEGEKRGSVLLFHYCRLFRDNCSRFSVYWRLSIFKVMLRSSVKSGEYMGAGISSMIPLTKIKKQYMLRAFFEVVRLLLYISERVYFRRELG